MLPITSMLRPTNPTSNIILGYLESILRADPEGSSLRKEVLQPSNIHFGAEFGARLETAYVGVG